MKKRHDDLKNIKTIISIFILVIAGFLLGSNQTNIKTLLLSPTQLVNQKDSISVNELAKRLTKKEFTFINVHTPYAGEIEKTDTFIPFDQIVANAASLPKDKNAAIILYCKSGRMSSEAIDTMKKLGFTNVRHLVGGMDAWKASEKSLIDLSRISDAVLPSNGFDLPIPWGTIGPKLISLGVIDKEKFLSAVQPSKNEEEIITNGTTSNITINAQNSQFVVDLLWAIGLSQKSIVYDEGPMGKEYKKDIGNFSSTGGWTLARGNAVSYLNKFDLIALTADQQRIVAKLAKNVYRPCCGNSTWFPDCNHGMAALAAIELMVSADLDEATIYNNVLKLNSFWFPDSYLTVATYFARKGTPWKDIDAKTVLGETYSSGQGAGIIKKKVGEIPGRPPRGGSCGA